LRQYLRYCFCKVSVCREDFSTTLQASVYPLLDARYFGRG